MAPYNYFHNLQEIYIAICVAGLLITELGIFLAMPLYETYYVTIIVKFDLCDEEILFDYDTCNNLELAYAVTVHLFQGSQVENVLIGIDNGSFIMNTKELVYTAITRASKHCTLLAENSALRHAINTSSTAHKNTFLRELLMGVSI